MRSQVSGRLITTSILNVQRAPHLLKYCTSGPDWATVIIHRLRGGKRIRTGSFSPANAGTGARSCVDHPTVEEEEEEEEEAGGSL